MLSGCSHGKFWIAIVIVSAGLGFCLNAEITHADGPDRHLVKRINPSDNQRIRRNYRNMSRKLQSGYAILLEGSPGQIRRLSGWLDEIGQTEIGRDTLDAIGNSGNVVTIRHSEWALVASGRTHAPLSSRLTDGRGEDALILFDARIPDSGSHHVFDRKRQPILFSAVQNLFHELSHARHLTNGSWRYFDSEGQAIEEENQFRKELAIWRGDPLPPLRFGKWGHQFWWPDTAKPPVVQRGAVGAQHTATTGLQPGLR